MNKNISIAIGSLSGVSIFILSLAFAAADKEYWYLPILIVLLFIILIVIYISDNKSQICDTIKNEVKDEEAADDETIHPLTRVEKEYLRSEKVQEHRDELWNIISQMNSSER